MKIARNQARMGLPLQEVQRGFQNMEEKVQAEQAHPKAGLSLQGPEAK